MRQARKQWVAKEASTCEGCGTSYHKQRRKQRFCSKSCGVRGAHTTRDLSGRNNPNWKGGDVGLFCAGCGTTFTVPPLRAGSARFCTLTCFNLWQRVHSVGKGRQTAERALRPCRQCGKPMLLRVRDRQKCCSDICRGRLHVVGMAARGHAHSRARHGRRSDLNDRYFRSSWEANYARYLNFLQAKGLIVKWEYESETFWFEKIRRGVRSYTPDFKVWETEEKVYRVEVKGWMDARSKTKIKRMAKYHPTVELRVVDKKQYQEIAKTLGAAIPHWEKVA